MFSPNRLPYFPQMQNLFIHCNCNIPIEYFEKYLTNLTALTLDKGINICYDSAMVDIAKEEDFSSDDFLKSKSIYLLLLLGFNLVFLIFLFIE
jgi:hypothetical protein